METITKQYIINLVATEWEVATKQWEEKGYTVDTQLNQIVVKRMSSLGKASTSGRITITANYINTQLHSELLDTVRHEICHLLVGVLMGHNKYWRYACQIIGCEPTTGKAIKDETYIKQAYKYVLYAVNAEGEKFKLGFRNRKDKKFTEARKNRYSINGFGKVEYFYYQPQ